MVVPAQVSIGPAQFQAFFISSFRLVKHGDVPRSRASPRRANQIPCQALSERTSPPPEYICAMVVCHGLIMSYDAHLWEISRIPSPDNSKLLHNLQHLDIRSLILTCSGSASCLGSGAICVSSRCVKFQQGLVEPWAL